MIKSTVNIVFRKIHISSKTSPIKRNEYHNQYKSLICWFAVSSH